MTERVTRLAKLSRERDLYEATVTPEFDPMDLALPTPKMNAKRIIEYILCQPVYLTEDNRYTGMLRFKTKALQGTPADVFSRSGHENFKNAKKALYWPNYQENLTIFEWQHSAPNYTYIVENGIEGSLEKIAYYKEKYRFDKEKYEYLEGVEHVCRGLIKWSEKCADAHEAAAAVCGDEARRAELLKLAEICRRVPRTPARSFYEGLQAIIFCFQFLPDSVGTIDRTLLSLYEHDIQNGIITREEAKELLAEFFIHLSAHTPAGHAHADKSAECHFAIGGYNERMEDGFTDLSRAMVEALMEIDTRRPAMSLRWTKKTPFEVLKFMLDCERRDKNKRFAFVNDEPRIKALTEIVGLPLSEAVRYTMVGCNEPSFPGTLWLGGCTANIMRCLVTTLYEKTDEIVKCETFDEFYEIFRREMASDLDRILWYSDQYDAMRTKDVNVLSAFLLDGCIEKAASPTQYGSKTAIGGIGLMGLIPLIDSLSIIKQFVFEEKKITMEYLVEVLRSNWEKDDDLRTDIYKRGRFFGNADPLSDEMARRVSTEIHDILITRRLANGAHPLVGTLAGYNPHHMEFGRRTPATPDTRYDGDGFMVGTGQCGGKDRNGLLALMQSLAQMDPTGILSGPTVCNMMIDGALMKNDEYFDKVCHMIEEYFKLGGLHVQLNYVTREELLAAREDPAKHGHLKVRVSGFSASFNVLPELMQEEIVNRTVQQA